MMKLGPKSLTIILSLGITTPLAHGQTAAPSPPAPPQSAAPETPPVNSASPASELSPRTKSALKLAGLVTFVANSCPTLKPNYPRFQATINALGVTESDLNKPDFRGRYLGYTAIYNNDVKTSCQRADREFGPQGTTLPNIFEPRSANILPPQ